VTYRQNTELAVEAWQNRQGTWSDPNGEGYATGSSTPVDPLRYTELIFPLLTVADRTWLQRLSWNIRHADPRCQRPGAAAPRSIFCVTTH
jgi:hypothetical protein